MFASLLNKQLVIEKEVTSTNIAGTPERKYEFLKETWAQKVQNTAVTQYNPQGQLPFSTDDFIIRFDQSIDYKCRLIYNNNYYKIEGIDFIGRRQWMKLKCIVWERATQY
jgi:SPP1 family predicted phage head-tail adaptor